MRARGLVALLGLAGLALVASALPEAARAAPDNPPRAGAGGLVGATAPPFHTTRVSGPDPAILTDLRGRVVILDFWATWCGPCRQVMPVLDEMHQRYHGRGLTVIGISAEPRGVVEQHLLRNPVRYTMALDVQGTGRSYGIHAIPTLVIIDRRGKVRRVYAGLDGSRLRELDTLVPALLSE